MRAPASTSRKASRSSGDHAGDGRRAFTAAEWQSALDSTAASAIGEGFEFGEGHAVPVAGDGVLPGAGGGGELDGVIGIIAAQEGEYKTASEGVAGADAV